MSEKKLAKVFYADVWGLREEKYKYLFKNDVQTTNWQELEPTAPYYFFVPKDFALQAEYVKFWKITDIFGEWSFGVATHRDHFVVGFTKEEIMQRLRIFKGKLPDGMVKDSLKLKDTRDWDLSEARKRGSSEDFQKEIIEYAYRVFDNRLICYSSNLIEFNRSNIMQHILGRENFGLILTRRLRDPIWRHAYSTSFVTDKTILSSRDNCYFFPLYIYPEQSQRNLYENRLLNLTPEFLQAIKASLSSEPTPEEIFYYIYAVLYSPEYRKRYQEFLKIDFPRVPLPPNDDAFKELSNLGKELVNLHLLKHPDLEKTGVGFPKGGSNKVEKIKVVGTDYNLSVYINKEQYFDGIQKEVWEYQIGAYQVMEKYLKDRKGRKLSLDEINHYMKVAKALRLTIELQQKIDDVTPTLTLPP
jgi:predicted helicase